MSVITSTPIPAGWYPDPHGNPQQRWWDGDSWTSDVAPYEAAPVSNPADYWAPRTVPTVLPSYNAVTAYGAVQTYNSEPAYTSPTRVSTTERLFAEIPYEPFATVPKATAGIQVSPTQRFTVSVWLFALTPLALALLSITLSHGPAGLYTRFSQGGLAALALVAMILLAVRDRRDLQLAGHVQTASPWWMLLSPLGYLLARAIYVRKQTGYSASSPLLIGTFVIVMIVAWAVLLPAELALVLAASPV